MGAASHSRPPQAAPSQAASVGGPVGGARGCSCSAPNPLPRTLLVPGDQGTGQMDSATAVLPLQHSIPVSEQQVLQWCALLRSASCFPTFPVPSPRTLLDRLSTAY
ncbi:hypothetical protein NDU88_002180 [Pleurodeles waltl]|uniref:Uncharacterized protein n=1 Tax=Pleurodeles waltl TaxID=8319 RepID=A0AAV7P8Q6_PLEWA|nr:hypothetical protein NDU88_002180 [Pleurodeles waltl]